MSGRLCYLLQPMSHHIKGVKRERDGWIKGRMESSWRIGVCPNSDSLLAERGGRDAQLRAQSFPACLVPYIDRLAEIKENMNRDLGFTVIHIDHTERLSSGLQSYKDVQLLMPQWQSILGPIVSKLWRTWIDEWDSRWGKKNPTLNGDYFRQWEHFRFINNRPISQRTCWHVKVRKEQV